LKVQAGLQPQVGVSSATFCQLWPVRMPVMNREKIGDLNLCVVCGSSKKTAHDYRLWAAGANTVQTPHGGQNGIGASE
jgi:hypothetical protein